MAIDLGFLSVLRSTLEFYRPRLEADIYRRCPILKAANKFGSTEWGVNGKSMQWSQRVGEVPVTTRVPGTSGEFPMMDMYRWYDLPWANKQAQIGFTKEDLAMNAGKSAKIRVWTQDQLSANADMIEDIGRAFMQNDISDAGMDHEIAGFPSFLNHANVANATDARLLNPTGTYGGLPITYGNYGGAAFDKVFTCTVPVLIDYTNAAFVGGATWALNAREALRLAAYMLQDRMLLATERLTMMLARDLHNTFKTILDASERIVAGSDSSEAIQSGFKSVIRFEEMDVAWDGFLTAAEGIGMPLSSLMVKTLFPPKGKGKFKTNLIEDSVWYDENSDSYHSRNHFCGQLGIKSPSHAVGLFAV